MFQPPVFQEERQDVLQDLIVAHPFATIVTSATGVLTADHVPLVLKATNDTSQPTRSKSHVRQPEKAKGLEPGLSQNALEGHIAAANPLFRHAHEPIEVLAIFQGPQTYVTPSWYASKQEHGKVVPTWNYVVVHVRGELRFTRDPEWLMRHLNDLTDQHESHRDAPWAVADAPEDFVKKQLNGLVGFDIAIDDMQGTWKVSQNKALKDWTGVKEGLEEDTSPNASAMAKLVEERARR